MSSTLWLREQPDTKLSEVLTKADATNKASKVIANKIEVDLLGAEPYIAFESDSGLSERVPVTADGIEAVSKALSIPTPFFQKLPRNLKQTLVAGLLEANPGDRLVKYVADEGILAVKKPNALVLDATELLEATAHVVTEDALVPEYWIGDEFRIDVLAPEGTAEGGDFKEGDVTRGGLRIACNLRRGLAPSVAQLLWRLACTNGMEIADEAWRIDARGSSNEEIIADFERQADLAFRTVERSIGSFYETRENPVENPERWLVRFARERGVPERTLTNLLTRAASSDLPDEPSEFDLINLVTNEANNPAFTRDGGRRILQRSAGVVVTDHAARCGHCRSKLN